MLIRVWAEHWSRYTPTITKLNAGNRPVTGQQGWVLPGAVNLKAVRPARRPGPPAAFF